MNKIFGLITLIALIPLSALELSSVINFTPAMIEKSKEILGSLLHFGAQSGYDAGNNKAYALYWQLLQELNTETFEISFPAAIRKKAVQALELLKARNPEAFDQQIMLLQEDPDNGWIPFVCWAAPQLIEILHNEFESPMHYYVNFLPDSPGYSGSIEDFFELNGNALDPKNKSDWDIVRLSFLVCLSPRHMKLMAEN